MMKKMMRVFLRAVLCGILPLSLLLGGLPVAAYTGDYPQQLTAGADIRFMTYNVLVDQDTANGGYSWGGSAIEGNRGPKAAAMINYYQPDVIALEEFSGNWYTYFQENLPNYGFGEMNSKDSQNNGKLYTCVAYNKNTIRLLDTELYRMKHSRWGTQGMRYVNVCFFEVIATGEKFIAAATHTDAGSLDGDGYQRPYQVKEIADYLVELSETYRVPVICGGDYNCSIGESTSYKHMTDAGLIDVTGGRYIDHIFHNNMASHLYETTVSDADVSGASDHSAVFADMVLEDVFSFPTTTTTTTTRPTWTTTAPLTAPPLVKPTDAPTTAGTTAADTTTGAVSDPTKATDSTTAAPSDADATTTAPAATNEIGATPDATTPSTDAPSADDQPVEADPVPKGNDADLYASIAAVAAAVAVGAGIAIIFLLKKKR